MPGIRGFVNGLLAPLSLYGSGAQHANLGQGKKKADKLPDDPPDVGTTAQKTSRKGVKMHLEESSSFPALDAGGSEKTVAPSSLRRASVSHKGRAAKLGPPTNGRQKRRSLDVQGRWHPDLQLDELTSDATGQGVAPSMPQDEAETPRKGATCTTMRSKDEAPHLLTDPVGKTADGLPARGALLRRLSGAHARKRGDRLAADSLRKPSTREAAWLAEEANENFAKEVSAEADNQTAAQSERASGDAAAQDSGREAVTNKQQSACDLPNSADSEPRSAADVTDAAAAGIFESALSAELTAATAEDSNIPVASDPFQHGNVWDSAFHDSPVPVDDEESLLTLSENRATDDWIQGPDAQRSGDRDVAEGLQKNVLVPAAVEVLPGTESAVAVPPPVTGATAQVILILTSLGSFRHQFFSSLKAKHFLDCKGTPYFAIDANSDVSSGAELLDAELLASWKRDKLLLTEDETEERIMIPQVLIDGYAVGNETAMQDFEEDGDLDWMLARAACPRCLEEKAPEVAECPSCSAPLKELVDEELGRRRKVQWLCRGVQYSGEELQSVPLEKPKEVLRRKSDELSTHHTLDYEALFGEPPPE